MTRQTAIDPVSLLKEDHQKVKQLFQQFENAQGSQKETFGSELIRELQIHTKVEEELFYPAVKKLDEEMIAEAIEEHNVVDHIIEELEGLSSDDEAYEAKFTVLKENVEHHIEEEEGEMFPEASRGLGDLEGLGRLMMERKQVLVAEMSGRKAAPRTKTQSTGRSTRSKSGAGSRGGGSRRRTTSRS